jgi:hypothetical protein
MVYTQEYILSLIRILKVNFNQQKRKSYQATIPQEM